MPSIHRPSSATPWTWISLIGPDARDFLHRLSTVNVQALPEGRGAPGFFLNASGRIRAAFTLWCYRPGEYALETAWGPVLELIEQFHFAEKLTASEVPGLACAWLFDADSLPPAPFETTAIDEEIRLCNHGSADYGRPWITAWGRPARLEQWLDRTFPEARAATLDELERWRIGAARPRAGAEINEGAIPLELGLREGIAENKGCYPGQEVIERIISLGAPARRLARLDGSGPAPAPGDKILSSAEPPAELGEVTSVVTATNGFSALGFVRKVHAREGLEVRFGGAASAAKATIGRVAAYE
jgi:folate-binding protein YgfZ